MNMSDVPNLRERRILIIESEHPFVYHLRAALEEEGAETVVVTDPYSVAGADRISMYSVCAAAVNDVHRSVAGGLKSMPVLVYGREERVPAEIGAVVRGLKEMLTTA